MNTGINLKMKMFETNEQKNATSKKIQKNMFQYNRKIPGRRRDDCIQNALKSTLFNEIPLAIFYQDLNLRYISVNQAFAQFVGQSPENIVGKSVTDLFPAEQAEKLQASYKLALKTERKLTNIYQWPTNDHENRLLTQKLFSVQEDERRSLARDLHDELGQWLIAIQTEVEEIKKIAGKNKPLQSSIRAVQKYAKSMHKVIRSMLQKLRPVLLDTLGLTLCLYEQKKDWSTRHPEIDYELIIEEDFKNIDESISIIVYRIIQEALNNVCLHAQATKVQICLSREKNEYVNLDHLCLRIKDNGVGFDPNKDAKGYGLLGMRERAIAACGDFTLRSKPGEGTLILAKLPLAGR